MKKSTRTILAVFLLFACIFTSTPMVHASGKVNHTRAIAIVFDNSGSMYNNGDQAWCRATYAMEVFASMLNAGDTLLIYPMHPITVAEKEYTMEAPLRITDAAQASMIRDIYTPRAGGTPIESVDCAVQGLQSMRADKKYMIVLTDGDAFYMNGSEMSKAESRRQLDARFREYAGRDMTVMYLGIGSNVAMPDTEQSEYFVKRQAKTSEDALSMLTEACNLVFGRDTLPENHKTEKTIDFDISMSKLIVFVQGESVSDVKVTGESGLVGRRLSAASTKYGTAGCGNRDSVPDTSLQGMMVTYADCAPGRYTIDYEGTATSIEVYYEPDADLDFVFTEADGNDVDPNALYEGNYKVSFGMKDAKTGKLLASDLLGYPKYHGSYSVNGEEVSIIHEGYSGEVPVSLNMGDTFDAKLTVTYLSGYTITKDSTDFGWPEGGIRVAARPAGELRLEITGGQELCSLQDLEESEPYIAKVFYQGKQLTGEELNKVDLKWNPDTSNAEIKQEFAEDHYKLRLHYKDPAIPQDTACGECTVDIHAFYTAQGSNEAQTQTPLTYSIDEDFAPLQMELYAPQDYIVIGKLEEEPTITVNLTANGEALSPEVFAGTQLRVDCGGIEHRVTAGEDGSSYVIHLMPTQGIKEGGYTVSASAQYTDRIGRTTQTEDSAELTLSNMPLWLKWLIGLLLLLLLIIIIWLIMHIKVFPKSVRQLTDECYMGVNGKNVAAGTTFNAKLAGKRLTVGADYNGQNVGISLRDLKPGPNGVLCKASHKRNISVAKPNLINMAGEITQADINGVSYIVDKATGGLVSEDPNQRPYLLANANMISFDGKIEDAGKTKKFHAEIPLTFKK